MEQVGEGDTTMSMKELFCIMIELLRHGKYCIESHYLSLRDED